MGKGGQNVKSEKGDRNVSWEEIKQHTKEDDKWLVINNNVYDITRWSRKHPGGRRVLSHYAGQDATEAIRAFHNDLNLVEKYMKPIHVGKLNPNKSEDEELRKDFEELRQTAHKLGYFKPSFCFFSAMTAHIVLFEVLTFYILYNYGTDWTPWLLSAFCQVMVQGQSDWLQHDIGHLSVFKSSKLSRIIHLLMINTFKGQTSWLQHDFGHISVFKNNYDRACHIFFMSITKGGASNWWNHMHYQHHAKPNVMDKDPDVRLEALFVLGDTMAKKQAHTKKKTLPYNWQQHYFFATLPPLLFPVYFQIMVIRHQITRRAWFQMFMMLLFYVRMAVMYGAFFGLWGMFKWHFFYRVIESHWFVWVSQSNHIPMEIAEDKERCWFKLQLAATCDIEKSFFNDWFTGHLNFQIEHHLFPTMPRHNYYKVAPLVKSLCEKHGIKYQVKTLSGAFGDIIRALKTSGEVWEQYREAYHI